MKYSKFNALVDARNTNVVYELQKQYSSLVPDNGTIKVFCVSNAQYLSMKTLGQPLEPELEPAMTGIPQLRQFAMQLSAPRIEATRLQNVNACRMLLNTVGMWLKRQTVENPDEVLNKASEPQTVY